MNLLFGSSTLLVDLSPLSAQGLADFAHRCATRLRAGQQLVTLYGRKLSNDASPTICVNAVFLAGSGLTGELSLERTAACAGDSYPSLTVEFPAAQSYERELWEQTGLVPQGHPWLKPIRFEGARQQRMQEYPFFSVRGQEVHEVGVGPIHASVIEPGHFRFMCLGEQVQHLEIQLGYQHRGVEALLLRRAPLALAPLVESICGDSSVAYTWGYCQAIEALAGIALTESVELSRGVALEMERIAMHLATLNGLATDIAFLQGGGTYGRLRTAIINATQRVCGNRFGRGWLRPGHAAPLHDALRADLRQTLTVFLHDFEEVNALMLSSISVRARFQQVGVVSRVAAQELGLLGVAARACGVRKDVRTQLPGALYSNHPLATLVQPHGDCWDRMQLRMREVEESVRWLLAVLGDTANHHHTAPVQPMKGELMPHALCVSVIEGTRGPVVQALETGAEGQLVHYKVQDPSVPNWLGLAMAVRDNAISDFPICNKSFDLSYCGNDL